VLEVVEVIASIKGVDPSVVAEATFQNTLTVLFNSSGAP
jgi:Tat protein secretion system quality control protein TatD with DNase activity